MSIEVKIVPTDEVCPGCLGGNYCLRNQAIAALSANQPDLSDIQNDKQTSVNHKLIQVLNRVTLEFAGFMMRKFPGIYPNELHCNLDSTADRSVAPTAKLVVKGIEP